MSWRAALIFACLAFAALCLACVLAGQRTGSWPRRRNRFKRRQSVKPDPLCVIVPRKYYVAHWNATVGKMMRQKP